MGLGYRKELAAQETSGRSDMVEVERWIRDTQGEMLSMHVMHAGISSHASSHSSGRL